MLRLVFMGKFGPLAPAALDTVQPPSSITTLRQLRDWVVGQAPALEAAMAATPCKLIVNHAVVHDLSAGFSTNDEIAFLPPMSGG